MAGKTLDVFLNFLTNMARALTKKSRISFAHILKQTKLEFFHALTILTTKRQIFPVCTCQSKFLYTSTEVHK